MGSQNNSAFRAFQNADAIAGCRIGPGPIEDCLLGHPALRLVAVEGLPDPERTEIVKTCIVLNVGYCPGDALSAELKQYVRKHLAEHEYPRLIEYFDQLPAITTGKIMRRELRRDSS